MRRPLVLVTVSFLLGIILYELGPWPMITAVLLVASAAMIGPERYRQALVVVLVVGLVSSLYTHVSWTGRQHPLPVAVDDDEVIIEGTVLGAPEQRPGGQRFLLQADQIRYNGAAWSWRGTVQVTIAEPMAAQAERPQPVFTIHAGEHLRIKGDWRLYGPARNPGEPDWSKVMARRGINGSLWSQQETVTSLGQGEVSWWQRSAWSLRQKAIAVYERYLPAPYDALLAGLTLGADDRIPEEMVEDFQSAGVLHLLAVSGGNVAFVVGAILFVLRRVPIPIWLENLLLLAAIIMFALVTGAEASVVRACFMAGLLILARWLLRSPEFISVIALSALAMLIIDPYACYAAGFQLSYAAVIGLALWTQSFAARMGSLPNWIKTPLAATLAAQLGVLPLSIYYFNQVSLIAPVANLVIVALAVPVNFLAAALVLCSSLLVPVAWMIGQWTTWLLVLMTKTVAVAAKVPLATLTIPSIGVAGAGALYLWLFWLSTRPYWLTSRQRLAASLTIAWGLVIWWWHPWPYQWQITVLDVGQGDAIFMCMPNGRTVLVDGGGRRSPLPETVGGGVVVPFLRRQGVQWLDLMVVSHPHEDHYRGLLAVTDAMPVKMAVVGPSHDSYDENYQRWIGSLIKSRVVTAAAGDQIIVDPRISMEVMAPAQAINDSVSEAAVNNQSLVLRLRYGATSLLLTGDLEDDGERRLTDDQLGWDEQTVLKVGHHGSRSSTGDQLLSVVCPDLAVISVGEGNSFGHPSAETLTRLESAGSRVLRTDRHGAVTFVSDGTGWRVKTMR